MEKRKGNSLGSSFSRLTWSPQYPAAANQIKLKRDATLLSCGVRVSRRSYDLKKKEEKLLFRAMVRGLLNKLVSRSLSVAGQWQQQQLRRLNIHEYQVLLSFPFFLLQLRLVVFAHSSGLVMSRNCNSISFRLSFRSSWWSIYWLTGNVYVLVIEIELENWRLFVEIREQSWWVNMASMCRKE